MADLSRQAFTAPDISALTNRVFVNAEALTHLYRNEEQFSSNTYDDVDTKSIIPSILFWADKDLHYSFRKGSSAQYVSVFTEFDPRVPLRGGNFKRTEIGYHLPEVLTRDDDAKPGDGLITKKATYPTIYQDLNADMGVLHLRSCMDWHLLDFAKHFNNFQDYSRITGSIFDSMNRGLQLVDRLLVDTFVTSLFGGFLHCYPSANPLFRFFTDASDNFMPDESFSKNARQFYKKDGELAKYIGKLSKYTQLFFKAKRGYLTNLNSSEVIGDNSSAAIPKRSEMLDDTSDKDKTLKALRSWYLNTGSDGKYTDRGALLRRLSLQSFVMSLYGNIQELTDLSAENWSGHDFSAENKDKKGLTLSCNHSDLVVFLNNEDYEEAKNDLVGSPAMGSFTGRLNGIIDRLEAQGVNFLPLRYIVPGTAAIIDKAVFSIKEFYHSDNFEYFAYHLVESRIKHVFKQVVLYQKMVGRILQLAKGQKYAVPVWWGSKHLPVLTEK